MKVNDFMKKVATVNLEMPVYLIDMDSRETRKAETPWDFQNYYYDEKNYTLKKINLLKDRVIVYYQRRDD